MTDRWKCRQDEHGVAAGSNGSRSAGSLATVAQTPHCSARPRSRSQDLLHPQIDRLEFGRPNAHPASQPVWRGRRNHVEPLGQIFPDDMQRTSAAGTDRVLGSTVMWMRGRYAGSAPRLVCRCFFC